MLDVYLIDNHAITNPIFQIVRKTGKEKLDDRVWAETAKIRKIVLDAMVEIGLPEANYVMTNALVNTDMNKKLFKSIQDTAERRNATFVPVMLTCNHEEMLKRVGNSDRIERMKLTHIGKLRIMLEEYEPFPLQHENMLEIDTSKLSPEKSAAKIIDHIGAL